MADVKVDPDLFWQRLMKLHKSWNVRCGPVAAASAAHPEGSSATAAVPPCLSGYRSQAAREKEGLYKGADALVIDTGSANEDELYSKSTALQTWLLGYEFPDTVIALCSRHIYVLTSAKKGAPRRRPRRPSSQARARLAPASLRQQPPPGRGGAHLPWRSAPTVVLRFPLARCRVRLSAPLIARRRAVQYLQPLVSAENALLPLELLACEKKAPDKN